MSSAWARLIRSVSPAGSGSVTIDDTDTNPADWLALRSRSSLVFAVFLCAQVCDGRGHVRARRSGIPRDVLLRSIGKHLVFFLAPPSQRRCLLHLFTILI